VAELAAGAGLIAVIQRTFLLQVYVFEGAEQQLSNFLAIVNGPSLFNELHHRLACLDLISIFTSPS